MPYIGKTLIGWGVVRENPWHFAGLYPTQGEAQARADALCAGYIVRYGERHEASDSFLSGEPREKAGAKPESIFTLAPDERSDHLAAVAASIDERVRRGSP